jgi:membrane protein
MVQQLKEHLRFWRALFERFFAHRGASSAAALTYTTLFAVVPLMTVTFSILSAIPFFHGMGGQIQTFIFSNFVPSTGATVQEYLQGFSLQARQLTWVGILALAVTAYLMLLNIESAFNVIWHIRQPRRGVASFLLYWAILSLGPLLLGAGFVISTYIASLTLLSGPHPLPGSAAMLGMLPLLCSIGAFTLIYATVPNTRVPLKHAFVGGLFAASLFEAAKLLFRVYVGLFPSYELIYGAFATVPLFLLWIYLCWLIILFGAELVCSLSYSRPSQQRRLPRLLSLLGVLRVLYDKQQTGAGMSLVELEKSGWPLADEEWLDLLAFLEEEKLVCRSGSEQWMISRDLNHYSLATLLQRCPWPLPAPESLPEELDEAWYPALRSALAVQREEQSALFSGSLAQWLESEPASPAS